MIPYANITGKYEMLDINRLIAFLYNKDVRQQLIPIATSLQADDLIVVEGNICRGPGEAVGFIANSKLHPTEFDTNIIKETLLFVATFASYAPKYVFIIGDSSQHEYFLKKFARQQEANSWDCSVVCLPADKEVGEKIRNIIGD